MSDAMPSFARSGESGLNLLGGGNFVKIEAGKPVTIIPLTGVNPPPGEVANGRNSIISFNKYTLWKKPEDLKEGQFSPSFPDVGGKHEIGKILGLEPKFYGMLLCKVDGEEDEKILSMGASIFKQLTEIELTLGTSIKGRAIRITRKGSGMQTKYTVIPVGTVVNIEGEPELNLVDQINPKTREGIVELLEKSGDWPPPGGDPALKATAKGTVGAAAAKAEKKLPFATADDAAGDDEEFEEV